MSFFPDFLVSFYFHALGQREANLERVTWMEEEEEEVATWLHSCTIALKVPGPYHVFEAFWPALFQLCGLGMPLRSSQYRCPHLPSHLNQPGLRRAQDPRVRGPRL